MRPTTNRRPPKKAFQPLHPDALLKKVKALLAEEPEQSLRESTRPPYYDQQRLDTQPEGWRDDWLRRSTSPY